VTNRIDQSMAFQKRKNAQKGRFSFWRRGWDSNPR
jgi:hypothetical protein